MAIPSELQRTVTSAASAEGLILGYMMGQYVLNPWEDTVRIQRGGWHAYRIYDELLRDARVFGAFRKRIKATTAQEWEVIPASDDAQDTRAAEIVKAQLEAMKFDTYQARRLSAIMRGLSVGEAVLREPTSQKEAARLGKVIYADVKFRAPWHFRFAYNPETQCPHLHWVQPGGLAGEDVETKFPRKFLWYSWGSEYGDPYGKGLGHQLYWPAFLKREDLKLALFYADKFGMPTVDIEYDPEKLEELSDQEFEEAKTDAKDAGKKIRTEGTLLHSNAFTYKLLEATRRGDITTYTELIDYCDREIAISVLGSTQALDVKGEGTRATSEVHQADVLQLAEDDAAAVCERDNETLVAWITELNVPGATPPKVWRQFPDATDYKALAERDKTVMEAWALGLDDEYIERTYGIKVRKPEENPDKQEG